MPTIGRLFYEFGGDRRRRGHFRACPNEVSKSIATAPAPPKGLRIWILQALIWLGQNLKFWA